MSYKHFKVWPWSHLAQNTKQKELTLHTNTQIQAKMQIDMLLDNLPARNLTVLFSKLSLFLHLCPTHSPTSSPNLPACTHQYSKGVTVGFRHIGGAAQISVLILMGKGLWVQLQVTLRVAQEVGGWGRALGSDDITGMAMIREIMGCFTGSKRGEEKGDVESLWWCCLVRLPMCTNTHLRKCAGCKVFPTTHIQLYTTRTGKRFHPVVHICMPAKKEG